jgi:uncharacterized protein YbjT (DUF2867 family)
MDSIQNKKIVVFGGNGWLGRAAVDAAAAKGANIVIVSRHASGGQEGATAITGSITDASVVQDAIRDANGIVISVDAPRTPEQLEAVFVGGTRNVLETAPEDAQIVFMSHIGITDIEQMPEYNKAKLRAEELIRDSGIAYTIIRPAWVVSGQTGYKFEQGDQYTGRRDDIGHTELGMAIVAAFENMAARGKTFELYGGGGPVTNWASTFQQLNSDNEKSH